MEEKLANLSTSFMKNLNKLLEWTDEGLGELSSAHDLIFIFSEILTLAIFVFFVLMAIPLAALGHFIKRVKKDKNETRRSQEQVP